MEKISLTKIEGDKLRDLLTKSYDKLTAPEKRVLLKLGAKDFTKRFGKTIERLADE